ncbi:MAG: hypothetical protein JWP91_2085 [Fibrobacteres bacterium]|nr:hypothetical protein [Fibrobacterota bacterium]
MVSKREMTVFGTILAASASFAPATATSQEAPEPRAWFEAREDAGANFYSIQREFYREEETREKQPEEGGNVLAKAAAGEFGEEEDDDLFQFKRWEAYMEPRVYPSGDVTLPSRRVEEAALFLGLNGTAMPPSAGNWKAMGPTVVPTSGGGAGRLNFIRFNPRDPNIMYVGSPGGGLWTTSNAGVGWTTSTDNLNVLGVSDIVIDPNDDRVQYLATGDGDGSDTRSIGVLKSVDGGKTWNKTGLDWAVSLGRRISKLVINPKDPRIIMAAASNGIYRTADAGVTWTVALNQSIIKDIEFKPDDPNVVYAAGGRFYKSVDGGSSFAPASNLPTTARFAIAVTAADPNVVYALGSNQRDFQGFYRSSDAGSSFSTKSTSPNILGYSNNGSDVGGGQAFYDLGLGVSPTDPDYVMVGGINIWKSTNGGGNWTIASGNSGVHTDVHAVEFAPGAGNIVWAASDGGIFKTVNGGTNWTNLGNTLSIAEMYRLGASPLDQGKVMSGWQDNGTNLLSNGTWKHIYGGDGFECFFDWADTNYLYVETQNGGIARTSNGGRNWSNISPPGQTGPWNTSWMQDPKDAQVLYYGSTNIWKSTDRGSNWSQMGTLPGSGSLRNIVVDPANNRIVYGVKATALGRTTDGGGTWTNIATGLPTGSASISHIAIDNGNPNTLWAALSGYSAGNKVFKSTNAGTAWINYSEGLPNLPANAIVFQKGTAGGVYVAMDVGIFYRDNSMSAWVPFFANLPNVSVRELEIFYGRTVDESRLRAATFGRGLWESPLFNASPSVSARAGLVPIAEGFTAVAEKGRRAVSIRFAAAKPEHYRAELTDLKGAVLQSRDLGMVSGPYQGRFEIEAPDRSGLYLMVLKSGQGKLAGRVMLE